jgi:hypothetical protein
MMEEWYPSVGDLAVKYHSDIIGIVIAVSREHNQSNTSILLMSGDIIEWVSITDCFRWQPLRFEAAATLNE